MYNIVAKSNLKKKNYSIYTFNNISIMRLTALYEMGALSMDLANGTGWLTGVQV